MDPIGQINPLSTSSLARLQPMSPAELAPAGGIGASGTQGVSGPTDSFGAMLDNLVGTVTSKQAAAEAQTSQVLLGDSSQLQQSVVAMQEASVAFSLMVQVRNKLVESYQELMRMQV